MPGRKSPGTGKRFVEHTGGAGAFDDDTPISPTFDVRWDTFVSPFGIAPKITRASGKNAQGYHLDPVIEDLEAEIDKLKGGSFGVDRQKTQEKINLAQKHLAIFYPYA